MATVSGNDEIDLSYPGPAPMYATGWNRLQSVDLSDVKLPYYNKTDLHKLVVWIRYKSFRNDLKNTNPTKIIDRPTTDAAWLKALLRYFKRMTLSHPKIKGKTVEESQQYRFKMLQDGLMQRHHGKDDDVEAYWQERAKDCPGLNIEWIPDDTDEDHGVMQPEYVAKGMPIPEGISSRDVNKIGSRGSWYSTCNSSDWQNEDRDEDMDMDMGDGENGNDNGIDIVDRTADWIQNAGDGDYEHMENDVAMQVDGYGHEDMDMDEPPTLAIRSKQYAQRRTAKTAHL